MSMTVRGTKKLSKKMNAMQDSTKGKVLVRALVSGALIGQNDAKRNAPFLSGNLRRSIHIGGHEDLNPDGGNIVDRSSRPVPDPVITATGASVYWGTDVIYAEAQEFGTEHIPAHPYMRPSADNNRAAISREVGEALRDLIKAAI